MGTATEQQQLETAMVIANSAEMITVIINDLLGDNMSIAVAGELMDGDALTDTVTASLQRHLNPYST